MSPTEALLLTGLAVIGAGAGLDLAVGARRTWGRLLPYLASTAGSGCLVAAGVLMDLGRPESVDLGSVLDLGHTSLRLDPLAGLFLTITASLGVVLSVCMAAWTSSPGRHQRVQGHGTGAGYALLL
ncbi:MAG: hypothetical protein ACREC5_07340, partial [Thermoplasmata archaeon]